MNSKFSAIVAQVISLGTLVSYAVSMTYLSLTAPNEQLALHYHIYLSVGVSLMMLGYAGYWRFHPGKRPHSAKSAFLYTIFYGVFYVLHFFTKKR